MRKELILMVLMFGILVGASALVFAQKITGDTVYTSAKCPGVECTTGYPGSGSAGGCACPSSPTSIAKTSSETSERTGTTKISSARTSSVSPGRDWTKVEAAGSGFCYVKSASSGTSLFRGRFLGKLFE